MRKQILTLFVLVIGLMNVLPGQNGNGWGRGRDSRGSGWDSLVLMPVEPLSESERQGLLDMREEEKVARDVYAYLNQIWNQRTFSRISASEQQHMDAVKLLLDKYGIEDPVEGLEAGEFKSETMQVLYGKLIAEGSVSLEQALTVGARIEELDISDLLNVISETDNEDLLTLWQNLVKGSRNHLRAFDSRLELFGLGYTPQYISVELYEQIVSSDMERGFYDASGNPVSSGSGWNN